MRGLPNWKYASPAQEQYITRLANEAFRKRVRLDYSLDFSGRRLLKAEASAAIKMAKLCIASEQEG